MARESRLMDIAMSAGWDADQSYDLPEGDDAYKFLPPVQLPTAPAYKSALIEAQRGYMYRAREL